MFFSKLGIDLGTSNTSIFAPKKGILINEPSIVVVDKKSKKPLAIGLDATYMIGRTPDELEIINPIKKGVIADYTYCEIMLNYFINKISGKFRFIRPEIIVSVPEKINSAEKRAVIDICVSSGAKIAYVVSESIVSAIGCSIPIASPSGNMIVNMGGGTTEIAVISLGSIIVSKSCDISGNNIDDSIIDYLKKIYGLIIGSRTACLIKEKYGSAFYTRKKKFIEVKGRDVFSGLPRSVNVNVNDITFAIQDDLTAIIDSIKKVLSITPPELASDIYDNGIILTGGFSSLNGISKLFTKALQISVSTSSDNSFSTVNGIGTIIKNIEYYKKSVLK